MSYVGSGGSSQALVGVGYYDVGGYFYLPGATQADGAPQELRDIIHPHWATFPPQNQMLNGLLAFLYFLFWIVNGFGNTAVIAVFIKSKSLQTPANVFVANLAVADFLMMLSQGPFYIWSVIRSKWWSFGVLGCEIYGFTGGLFGIVAILSMAAIGLDRFIVITRGMSGPRIKIVHSIFLVGFIWAYALGVCLPPLLKVWNRFTPEGLLTTCSFDYMNDNPWDKSFVIFIFTFAYVVPLVILIICYSQIVTTVWAHERALKDQAKKMNVESLRASNNDAKEASVEMKIAMAALSSVFLWVIIWTPYAVTVMIAAFGDRQLITPVVSMIPAILCKCASCVNPVVFAISHPKFKQAFRKEYAWLYCASRNAKDGNANNGETHSAATTVKT
ncbi:Opsin, ultraviolet-sensitive [Orchesella cincta]|uniref:Opsin, ultraviolet-sensitive n=1 Tax=Orchesella cincta TaxID=48709 RepID=A0A1D2MP91_ORCCI|nr:Opsin, ultraviolet-sensitive [Orchesella cincta]